MDVDRARAHAVVDELVGPTDTAGDRAVAVLHAHAAALASLRRALSYAATPPAVAERLNQLAHRLRTFDLDRDPDEAFEACAAEALREVHPTISS